jgi:hypothetical protein
MDEASKEVVRSTKEDDLVLLHFSWGIGIRNGFGLWSGNSALLESTGSWHPDDASSVIIEAVWKRLRRERRRNHN